MLEPKGVFLPPDRLREAHAFRAPVRVPAKIEALVDGVAAFPEMERALARAERSVLLAMWSFDPDLPLVSLQQRSELPAVEAILRERKSSVRPQTWGDLLVAIAELGVAVRVLVSDFDPVFSTDNHRRSWTAFRRLHRLITPGSRAATNLEVIVPLHDAAASPAIQVLLTADQGQRIDRFLKTLNARRAAKGTDAAMADLAEVPGLWEAVSLDSKGRFRRTPEHTLAIHVGSHHLKLCLIDEQVSFIGGLDPERGRVDSSRHLAPRASWHDVHLRLIGPQLEDMVRTFQALWVPAAAAFAARVATYNTLHASLKLPQQRFAEFSFHDATDDGRPPELAGRTAQVLKTRSSSGGLLSAVPNVVRDDIERVYRRAIAAAEELVYIENQYVRWPAIADWLIERRATRPQLQVVMVVPVAPEEVTAAGAVDEITSHGLFLQRGIIDRLTRAFSADFAVVSPVRNQTATKPHATNARGSFQIYVHSKLLIVDDRFALIGTANANGRSFRVDTEMAVAWFDPAEVLALRRRLWSELLGSVTFADWPSQEFARRWTAAAKVNATATPGARPGLVVPHPVRPGRESKSLPAEYANLYDVVSSFPAVV